jgi:hypothetical protein
VDPFFIEKYYALLSNKISNFLDEMPLAVLNRVVFHQDGAAPHECCILIHICIGDRWMDSYGPTRWPARSPDLNPLDYFLWGYIQDPT